MLLTAHFSVSYITIVQPTFKFSSQTFMFEERNENEYGNISMAFDVIVVSKYLLSDLPCSNY